MAHNPMHAEDEFGIEFETVADTSKKVEPVSPNKHDNHDHSHDVVVAPTKVPEWIGDIIEQVFKVRKRKTTVEMEVFTGTIQFISCLYVLPVVPFQMARCGYDETSSCIATAITCAVGCIVGAFFTDMPLIIAPPTSVSIYFAVAMQQKGMNFVEGNMALIISGAMLTFLGVFPPLGRFFTRMIPDSIQAAISVGIGLITALAGATEVNLVVRGTHTILDMGEITDEVVIALCAVVIVAVLLHYHVKGAFCMGLVFGTFLFWLVSGEWPERLAEAPVAHTTVGEATNEHITMLIFNLFFLFILTLNGLARSLSDLAGLTKSSGAIPRGNFLFIVCGLTTMLSGYLSGPPILISPETAAGIKAGARTGLSTLVCGLLFLISTFFAPLFAAVPAAGTAPLLIMVGVMMFGNSKRIDWADYKIAVPAFCVLFFIPFTYSILRGVIIGYLIYIMIGLFTGEMAENATDFYNNYTDISSWARLFKFSSDKKKQQPLAQKEDGDDGEGGDAPDSAADVEATYHDSTEHTTTDEEEGGAAAGHSSPQGSPTRKRGNSLASRFREFGKYLDSMEMQDGGVTTQGTTFG